MPSQAELRAFDEAVPRRMSLGKRLIIGGAATTALFAGLFAEKKFNVVDNVSTAISGLFEPGGYNSPEEALAEYLSGIGVENYQIADQSFSGQDVVYSINSNTGSGGRSELVRASRRESGWFAYEAEAPASEPSAAIAEAGFIDVGYKESENTPPLKDNVIEESRKTQLLDKLSGKLATTPKITTDRIVEDTKGVQAGGGNYGSRIDSRLYSVKVVYGDSRSPGYEFRGAFIARIGEDSTEMVFQTSEIENIRISDTGADGTIDFISFAPLCLTIAQKEGNYTIEGSVDGERVTKEEADTIFSFASVLFSEFTSQFPNAFRGLETEEEHIISHIESWASTNLDSEFRLLDSTLTGVDRVYSGELLSTNSFLGNSNVQINVASSGTDINALVRCVSGGRFGLYLYSLIDKGFDGSLDFLEFTKDRVDPKTTTQINDKLILERVSRDKVLRRTMGSINTHGSMGKWDLVDAFSFYQAVYDKIFSEIQRSAAD